MARTVYYLSFRIILNSVKCLWGRHGSVDTTILPHTGLKLRIKWIQFYGDLGGVVTKVGITFLLSYRLFLNFVHIFNNTRLKNWCGLLISHFNFLLWKAHLKFKLFMSKLTVLHVQEMNTGIKHSEDMSIYYSVIK